MQSRWSRYLAAIVVTAGLVPGWAGSAQAQDTTIVEKGEQVPGLPAGVTFQPDSYPFPLVNGQSEVVFESGLDAVDGGGDRGLFFGPPGALQLVARIGDQAPGTDPGAEFGEFRQSLIGTESVAFSARLTGPGVDVTNDLGIWSGPPGNLELLLRSGDLAPGAGAEFVFSGSGFMRYGSAGHAAILGSAHDPSNASIDGIWSGTPGDLGAVALEGDQAIGFGVCAEYSFQRVYEISINAAGIVVWHGTVTSDGEGCGSGEGIWIGNPDNVRLLVRNFDLAPGTQDAFNGFDFDPTINDAGQVVFNGFLVSDGSGIWRATPTEDPLGPDPYVVELLLRTGDPIPGDGDGSTISGTYTPVINGSGEIMARAFYLGGSALVVGVPGNVQTLAKTGMAAPGTSSGESFASFNTRVLNDTGEVAFKARLQGPTVVSSNERGIWVGTPGNLHLVIREGDPFEVAPGDVRTVQRFSVFEDPRTGDVGTGNQDGRESFFSDSGRLVFWASFTDGSEGLFMAPPLPAEPLAAMLDGTFVVLARCFNLTGGSSVPATVGADNASWDCDDAGLAFAPGDTVAAIGVGGALGTEPVGGSVTGITPNGALCRNLTTAQQVFAPVATGKTSWDCEAAGLNVSPGQLVRVIGVGTAD